MTRRAIQGPSVGDSFLVAFERHPVMWLAGSAVLGIVVDRVGIAATALEWGVLLSGLLIAATSRRVSVLVGVVVYGGMSDTLWRTTAAQAPWEGAKYLIVAMSVIGLIRFARPPKRLALPVIFLLALVPAVAITVGEESFAIARDDASFALLGAVALATSTMFCRQLILTREEMRGLIWIAISPVVSVAAIATLATVTAKDLEFGTTVNFETSAGFGPNQISTILGLGALFCVMLLLLGSRGSRQISATLCGAWLIGQALITFARGGVLGFGLGAAAMLVGGLVLRGNRSRGLAVLAVGALVLILVLNWAQSFSGGALDTRYQQDDSGRGSIATAELELFADNPAGVGAGRAKYTRQDGYSGGVASHNEMTRMLAEHGYLGAAALALIALMAAQSVRWSNGATDKVIAVGFVVWSAATMFHSATRIAAVGLIFGLASLRLEPTRSELRSRVSLGLRHRQRGDAGASVQTPSVS